MKYYTFAELFSIYSEQSDPQVVRPNPSEVLDKIRGGIEVGNTKLAVAALAAHIAATTNISLTGENQPYQGGNAESYNTNRIRHRNPHNAVILKNLQMRIMYSAFILLFIFNDIIFFCCCSIKILPLNMSSRVI